MDNVNEVWEWAARFSERVHMTHELRELRALVRDRGTTCGGCALWMKKSCPRERHDNSTGRKNGPSCASIKCDNFAMSPVSVGVVAKAEARAAELSARLRAMDGPPAST